MRSNAIYRFYRFIAIAAVMLVMPAILSAGISISITIGPPVLPIYEQPLCPGQGYIWTPGYWAWAGDGYYWVPGTWVFAPYSGALWTPPYWGWNNGIYLFNSGYWGREVGFYGGVDYGYGYGGRGYDGGYWNNGEFAYNRSVNNINTTNISNVYNETVINNYNTTRVSYNGGSGGTTARPTQQQLAIARASHTPPTATQLQHQQAAARDQGLRASVNHGHPAIAATPRPGAFKAAGVVAARDAVARPVANAGANRAVGGSANGAVNRTPNRPGNSTATESPAGRRPLITAQPARGNPAGRPANSASAPGPNANTPRDNPRVPQQRSQPQAYAPQPREPQQTRVAPHPQYTAPQQQRALQQERAVPQQQRAPQQQRVQQRAPQQQQHTAPQQRPAPQSGAEPPAEPYGQNPDQRPH